MLCFQPTFNPDLLAARGTRTNCSNKLGWAEIAGRDINRLDVSLHRPGIPASQLVTGFTPFFTASSIPVKLRNGLLLILTCLLPGLGCSSPATTRYPTLMTNESAELQRREAQIQDPYPDSTTGPPTGFRPLGFQHQRSEPQQIKDRFYSGFLRNQFSTQPTTQPVGPGAYGPGNYSGAVQ